MSDGTGRRSYDIVFRDGGVIGAADRESRPELFVKVLAEHHGQKGSDAPAFCCCQSEPRNTRLYIGHREKAGVGYYLARYPMSGPEHLPDCEWYALPRESSGIDGYEVGVVEEMEDGTLKVRLKRPLRKKLEVSEQTAPPPEKGPPAVGRRSQAAMTLRGFLDLLWETAELNTWHPGMAGKRTAGVVLHRLSAASKRIRASRDLLQDVVVWGMGGLTPAEFQRQARHNRLVLDQRFKGSTPKERRLVVVVGVMTAIKDTVAGPRAVIEGMAAQKINVYLTSKLVDGLARSFPSFQRLRDGNLQDGERVLVLLHGSIEKLADGSIVYTDIAIEAGAALSISTAWIPVESSFERRVVELLVEQGRTFIKPLKFDATADVIFPDMLLTDAGVALWPMEVYGRTDPDYLQRKAAKEDLYPTQYPGVECWAWDVVDQDNPPAFPPKSRRRPAAA